MNRVKKKVIIFLASLNGEKFIHDQLNSIKKQTNSRTPQEGVPTSHKVKDKNDLLYLIEPDGWNTRLSKLIDFSEKNKNL